MAYTSGNDINILQASDSSVVGAGDGNDKYLLAPNQLLATQTINISDASGSNTLQLLGGLTIASSKVSGNAIQLILSNGATVNVLGADTFTFEMGGNPLSGQAGIIQTFAQFVTTSLGVAGVPTGSQVISGTGNIAVNADGSTNASTAAIILNPGTTTPVNATSAPDIFSFNVAAAKALTANTQIPITGFDVVHDMLQINTATALTNVTLAALNGVDGIGVQPNAITNSTVINFGSDANGDVISITLAGVVDPALVHVNGIATATSPTFTVSETSGVVTFGGTATGDITFTLNGTVATFARGGVTATTTADLATIAKITIGSGETLSATAAQITGRTIDGAGTVAITALESTLNANLSGIDASTVTATVTGPTIGAIPQFTGNLGDAQLFVNGALDFLNGSPTIGATASFVVNSGGYLMVNATDISGKTAIGSGQLNVFVMDQTAAANVNTQNVTAALNVTLIAPSTVDVSANTNLANIDSFVVHSTKNLTLTAVQAAGKSITGSGSVTVTGTPDAQTLNIATTGTNTITPGTGLDQITLGAGADTVVIGLGAAGGVSDSAPGYSGIAHTIDLIYGFSIGMDHLQLSGGTGVLANSVYGITFADGSSDSITVKNGVVTAATQTDSNVLIGELLLVLGTTQNSVAFVENLKDSNGSSYAMTTVLQGDGVKGGQISDIVVRLVGTSVTDLSTILSDNSSLTTAGTDAVTVTISAAGTSSAANGNVIFNVASGNYTHTITGFSAGDKLRFPTDNLPTVENTSFNDGVVNLVYASSGQVVTVSLTGLPIEQDGAIVGISSFNSVFGSGSII